MIRRLKKDVLTELPAKRRQIIELPANGCAKLIRDEAEAAARNEGLLKELSGAVQLAKLLDDEEAYAEAIAALRKAQGVAFEEMAAVRHAVALAKVPYVIEHVLNATGQVVVFAHHRDVVEKLIEGLQAETKVCVKVVGGMTDRSEGSGSPDLPGR